MKISGYDIKPVSVYLPDEQSWIERDSAAKIYFAEQGITEIEWVAGIHYKFGIMGTHIYLLDDRAEEQFQIGASKTAGFLTNYLMYSVMNVMPFTHFMYLETDCNFIEGWKEKLEQALLDVPSDFDYLYAGSCCAEDKEPVHVKGDVYHFPFRGEDKWTYAPQCGHFYIVAKKAIPLFIKTQRDCGNPADVSLIKFMFPHLKVYAILPRLADQGSTELPR